MKDPIYNNSPCPDIKTMYGLLNSGDTYEKLKETLNLPSIRKIGNELFIKTFDYKSNWITRFRRFFIVVDKDGKVINSYNNEYVKICPSFGLICGVYHNQIICEDMVEILYFTPLNKLQFDQVFGNDISYTIHSFDKIGENSMTKLFNNIYDYAKNFDWD